MGSTLSNKAVGEIKKLMREFNAQYKNTAGHRARYTGARKQQGGTDIRVGVLTTGLSAASAIITGGASATATRWTITSPVTGSAATTIIDTITNLSTAFSGASGDLVFYYEKGGLNVVLPSGGASGGGGSECDSRNETWHMVVRGSPTTGSFDMNLLVNSVTSAVNISYNDASSDIVAAIEGHSEVATGDVSCTGGPLPNATVIIEFQNNLAATDIPLPYVNFGGLSGGSGVGVTMLVDVQGHSS